MAFVRVVLNFIVAGALLGIVVVTLVAPGYLQWDNTAATGVALCNCADTTRQTADKLIHLQLVGGASGALLGTIVGVFFALRRRKKAAQLAAETPAK